MKAHEPMVQFTFFPASGFIDLVFRKPWVCSPKKPAEIEARSNIDILNLSTYNSDVQSIYPLCFFLGGVNGFSEKWHCYTGSKLQS